MNEIVSKAAKTEGCELIRMLLQLFFYVGVVFAVVWPVAAGEGQIVFVSSRAWPANGTNHELFIVNADGSDIHQVTARPGRSN